MAARRSAVVDQALRLVEDGKSLYEAARLSGVWPSTLYRALYPKGKKNHQKAVDKAQRIKRQ